MIMTLMAIASSLSAEERHPKRTLKMNYEEVFNETPGSVDTFGEMFTEGMFYGRLRSNTFYFHWDEEDSAHSTHLVSGLGGSMVYKSATLSDIDLTAGLYYAHAFFDDKDDPVAHLKAGKDTLSRSDYANTGNKSMGVLGQAYLRYRGLPDTEVLVGRQLVETFYTRSNDTKMIPNTFDAVVVDTKAVPDTTIKVGYLHEQKLRDHTQTHSVLMYGDANSSSSIPPQWSENDDTAMHRGLTYSALKAAGKPTDAPLITGDLTNHTIDGLEVDFAFYVVPELLSQVMTELDYTIELGKDFSIAPGVRYIRQFDKGAGAVGGASYLGRAYTTDYQDPDSLDTQMIAARVIAKVYDLKVNLAFSKVFDEADLVTPWRGFPTSGYTRSMGRFNWRANTTSYRIMLDKMSKVLGIYEDVYTQAAVLYTDGDDDKRGVHVQDELHYYLGLVQTIPTLLELQWRLRFGYTHYLDEDASQFDNLDARFEINYLF